MSSSVSAGSSNDAILVNRGDEFTNTPIMLGQQQQEQQQEQHEDERNEQQQLPSAAEGGKGSQGGGPSRIQIYIHSPTTTTPSVGSSTGDRENQMQQYNRPKMFRKLSNSSSIISELFKHPTDESAEERLREKIKRANDRDMENNNSLYSRDLVELLSTTSPPPHVPTTTRQSRMSFSSLIHRGVGFSSSSTSAPVKGKGKTNLVSFWAACKRLKTKIMDHGQSQKQNRKETRNERAEGLATSEPASFLMLPDSEVAGRTSGGYRHIAISIPIAEEHSGDDRPSTSRNPARQSMSPSIQLDQVPRRVSSVAARRPQTASNPAEDVNTLLGGSHLNPYHTTRPREDGLRPSSRHLEHARPRTADPLGGQRNTSDSFGSSDDLVTEGSQYPIRNHNFEYSGSIDIHESAEGLSVRGQHHWSLPAETSRPRQHEQGSQLDTSMAGNERNTQAMLTNATTMHHEYPPEMPKNSHPPVVSRLRRVQSVLSFQGMGIALTTSDLTEERSMGQLRYREIINHHSSSPSHPSECEDGRGPQLSTRSKSSRRSPNLRSLTINLPPPYHHGQYFVAPASAVGVVTKPLSNDSLRRLEQQSKIREPEPLRFSSIMTVADVKPTSSTESPKAVDNTDGTSSPNHASFPERPPLSAVLVPSQHYHHRPSIDQVLFPSPSWDPPYPVDDGPLLQSEMNADATAEPQPARTNVTTGTRVPGKANKHKVARSESHQALVKQYEALREAREARERELGLLVDRLEVLEHKNEWWLNSVIPMVDSMAKRLTRVYDDQSLPRLTRERARIMRRDMANSGGDVSNSSSLDLFLPRISLPSPLEMPTITAHDPQPRVQKRYSDRQRRSLSLLEPESSLDSFDSFSFNRHHSMPQHRRSHSQPFTSVAPPHPARVPSPPYPDSYIYWEEFPEDLGGDRARGHETEQRRSRTVSADAVGSVYTNNSVPRPSTTMQLTSSCDQAVNQPLSLRPQYNNPRQQQDQESPTGTPSDAGHTYDFGFGFGHEMGLAVDRLPSRHGEKSLLNTISLPGGGASRSNSGHNTHDNGTSPHGSSPSHRSYSSARTIDSAVAAASASASAAAEGVPVRQSQPRTRLRPHSLFIPRQTSLDDEEEENNSQEEGVFEEERRRPDESTVRIHEENSNGHERRSRNIRWIPSFSTVTSSSSGGDRPRVRPISWPSSYRPPAQAEAQTQTQTHSHGRSHHRPSASTPAAISVPVPSSSFISMAQGTEEAEHEQNQKHEAEEKEQQRTRRNHPTSIRSGQKQQQQQQEEEEEEDEQRTPTEWDTLEPLMRGLMETSRLDLELGRDLDLEFN